jgi:hypothetical protein
MPFGDSQKRKQERLNEYMKSDAAKGVMKGVTSTAAPKKKAQPAEQAKPTQKSSLAAEAQTK